MQSKDVLKNALLQYTGSLILVSHDRDFLEGLTDKIIEFKEKKINTFIGDVYEFLEKKKMDSLQQLQAKAAVVNSEGKTVSSNKELWEKKKEEEARNRKIQNKLRKIEEEIEKLNEQLIVLEEKMSQPEKYANEIADGTLYQAYEKIKNEIAAQEELWLEIQE
jgi:ATP-binding cassette subfamily F protein 3